MITPKFSGIKLAIRVALLAIPMLTMIHATEPAYGGGDTQNGDYDGSDSYKNISNKDRNTGKAVIAGSRIETQHYLKTIRVGVACRNPHCTPPAPPPGGGGGGGGGATPPPVTPLPDVYTCGYTIMGGANCAKSSLPTDGVSSCGVSYVSVNGGTAITVVLSGYESLSVRNVYGATFVPGGSACLFGNH